MATKELEARFREVYLAAAESAGSEEERDAILDLAAEEWERIGQADSPHNALLTHLAGLEAEGFIPEPQTSAIAESNLTVDVAAAIAAGQITSAEQLAEVTDQADEVRAAAKATREKALRAFGGLTLTQVLEAQRQANRPSDEARAAYAEWAKGTGAIAGGAHEEFRRTGREL